MRTTHEFRDFELSCEKHIMALASTKTGTYLSSSSGPSGPRTRMFRPLSGPSGPRVTMPFFFFLVTTLPRALASALTRLLYPRTVEAKLRAVQLRRLVLLIVAITVHNFPEGLAVGVGYASVGRPGEGYIYS